MHLLPMEIGSWWLRRMGIKAKEWVCVSGGDGRATFCCQLLMRWPVAINVLFGNCSWDPHQVFVALSRDHQFVYMQNLCQSSQQFCLTSHYCLVECLNITFSLCSKTKENNMPTVCFFCVTSQEGYTESLKNTADNFILPQLHSATTVPESNFARGTKLKQCSLFYGLHC